MDEENQKKSGTSQAMDSLQVERKFGCKNFRGGATIEDFDEILNRLPTSLKLFHRTPLSQ
jgi:hypothetical protein